MKNTSVPNPGSDKAIDLGCTCPVLDNYHGAGFGYIHNPEFWIDPECPLHGDKTNYIPKKVD